MRTTRKQIGWTASVISCVATTFAMPALCLADDEVYDEYAVCNLAPEGDLDGCNDHPTLDDPGSSSSAFSGATLRGGIGNFCWGNGSTLSGGENNYSGHDPDPGSADEFFRSCTVCGGRGNLARGDGATVIGGENVHCSFAEQGYASAIGGALHDILPFGTVIGGSDSDPTPFGFVGGGDSNCVFQGSRGVAVGGELNTAADQGVVLGGRGNVLARTTAPGDVDTPNPVYRGACDWAAQKADSTGSGFTASIDLPATRAVILGGHANNAAGDVSFVGGGHANHVAAENSESRSNAATIVGGDEGAATGEYCVVGGGEHAHCASSWSVAVGGAQAFASGAGAVVGSNGTADAPNACVLGGASNIADSQFGTVLGGDTCSNAAAAGMIGGGLHSEIRRGNASTVVGGLTNSTGMNDRDTSVDDATVIGGSTNAVRSAEATIVGGRDGVVDASATGAVIAGGTANRIGNGDVPSNNAAIGGGALNTAVGVASDVVGGEQSSAMGSSASITGGIKNSVSADFATILGGRSNAAPGEASAIGGGSNNEAEEQFSTVPGGTANSAHGIASLVAGHAAVAADDADGTFVWNGDNASGLVVAVENMFAVRAPAGMWIGSKSKQPTKPVSGRILTTSAGAYVDMTGLVPGSDRETKDNITPIDGDAVMSGLRDLEIARWRYTVDPSNVHIGPMAQDAASAFGRDVSDGRSVSIHDEQSIALAAVAVLARETRTHTDKLEQLASRIARSEVDVATAERQAADFQARVAAVENSLRRKRHSP